MARSVPRASASSGRARPASASARSSSSSSAASSSRRSTSTWQRDSSAPFSAKDGFSVVAPTRVTVPSSTTGRKPSCCARLKRWISSTNSSVPCPAPAAQPALVEGPLQVGDAGEHRRERDEDQPGPLRQQPGDGGLAHPGRAPEDERGQAAPRQHPRQRAGRAEQVVLPDHLLQRLRPQPVGERARAGGRGLGRRFGRAAEEVLGGRWCGGWPCGGV